MSLRQASTETLKDTLWWISFAFIIASMWWFPALYIGLVLFVIYWFSK